MIFHYIKVFIGIFIVLGASRFIPHPWNFTSLLALSFYVPAILGLRYIPLLILSFAITDLFIGYHSLTHWTWGSVFLIGFLPLYFKNSFKLRIPGALIGALIFFLLTNFGVWANGGYGYTFQGLIACYTLAIPFFTSSLISTLLFSLIIEWVYRLYKTKLANESNVS
tara:strand:- start:1256 stop:1756 length:501 start_codon:yes stop_codon:yes gene_type:complete